MRRVSSIRLTRMPTTKPRAAPELWARSIRRLRIAAGVRNVQTQPQFPWKAKSRKKGNCPNLPQITEALVRKGYSDGDIRKILGENTLRVMEQVERVSHELQAQN